MSTQYMDEENKQPESSFKFKLPKKAYELKIVEVEFKRSKEKTNEKGEKVGNNPMLEFKLEVVAPEKVSIKVDGEPKEFITAGLKIMDWLVLTGKTKTVVKAHSERFGVDIPDDETPNVAAYIGKTAKAILKTTVEDQTDEETGEPILDSKDQPVKKFNHRIDEWLN